MVKGVVSPRPLAPNLIEDSAPSFRHAAAVTTYAAAGVSAAGASAPADCLVRLVIPDLDRVVRAGAVLRVQH
jgi:hypothetical protein